ncbi:hypothetical protein FsymDg_0647 [Candidatus Protofrankia datiscae]|uniref:Uncharacterized protein n=1 Tax=Candidatus Protofrankia datiscae TaxID=2716812 RepID=F8B1Q0_9ACTN|nr:hypothetical protein FsymDg_0647 [Candidatus Protofrankia datiscae]
MAAHRTDASLPSARRGRRLQPTTGERLYRPSRGAASSRKRYLYWAGPPGPGTARPMRLRTAGKVLYTATVGGGCSAEATVPFLWHCRRCQETDGEFRDGLAEEGFGNGAESAASAGMVTENHRLPSDDPPDGSRWPVSHRREGRHVTGRRRTRPATSRSPLWTPTPSPRAGTMPTICCFRAMRAPADARPMIAWTDRRPPGSTPVAASRLFPRKTRPAYSNNAEPWQCALSTTSTEHS